MSDNVSMEDDWQSQLALPDGLWRLFEQQLNCDIVFLVGPNSERIGAHSAVLMARSREFYKQICPGLPEKEIELADIQYEEMECFLRYLYKDELNDEGISTEKLLELAEKYQVVKLVRQLLGKQITTMRPEDFCSFVRKNYANDHMTDLMMFKCLEFVFRQPKEVFESLGFTLLPKDFLKTILDHERLVLEEEVIYKAVLLWSEKECEISHLQNNGENQRQVLGEVLFLVRFPLISQEYFNEHISEKNILTDHEEVQLLKYYLNPRKVSETFPFIIKKREAPLTPFVYVPSQHVADTSRLHSVESMPIIHDGSVKEIIVKRFTERGMGWGYRANRKDAIAFTVDQDIYLTHVYVYGNCKTDNEMDVNLEVRNDKGEIATTEIKVACKISHPTGQYEIGVENPNGSYGIRIKAKVQHHIVLKVSTDSTFYGKNGKVAVTEDGKLFEFKNSDFSTNHTTVAIGQIAGMKFCPV